MEKIEIVKPRLSETLLTIAHTPTFPLFAINLIKTNKAQSYSIDIKVSSSIYERLVRQYGSSTILFYYDMPRGRMEAWTKDMLMSFRLLNQMGLMSSSNEWLVKSRPYISTAIAGEKGELPKRTSKNEEALATAEDFIKTGKMIEEINMRPYLLTVAKDAILSGTKDQDTIIYRLAMALYHSKRFTDEPAIPTLEDPSTIYLNLISDEEFVKKYESAIRELTSLQEPVRSETVKTFISFVVAVYLYNKALIEVK